MVRTKQASITPVTAMAILVDSTDISRFYRVLIWYLPRSYDELFQHIQNSKTKYNLELLLLRILIAFIMSVLILGI